MLILQKHDNQVLLQRRPPTGIWGGLLSLPQVEHKSDIKSWVATHLGTEVKKLQNLKVFRHTFSHFHLDITPVKLTTTKPPANVRDGDNLHWYQNSKNHDRDQGFPKPVRDLLQQYVFDCAKI